MAEHLPVTDTEFVSQAQAEYDSLFHTGTSEEVEGARYRLVWALVHSPVKNHQQRGLDICRMQLSKPESVMASASGAGSSSGSNGGLREYRYFAAVACYNLGKYIDARREVAALLEADPHFRQGSFLKGLIEDAIVKEGLVGVGIGAAVVGVALAFLLSGKR